MSTPILATKLYMPPHRPEVVLRPRLIERLNEGLHRKLTLVSAPAGFGKTTLVSEWVSDCGYPVAWLSLDEGDNDPARFLTYFVAALQTIEPTVGEGTLGLLQSPQPPPPEALLTTLINDIAAIPDHFVVVLDDYHAADAKPIDDALSFFLEYLPPQMHLLIATREDPRLPLSRLRARSQLTELRATDLRFTLDEAADFLNQVMGLNLTEANVAALETRTEGWIAGLQLAAISMQGHHDTSGFIQSFTGSHRYILDYLVEEVLYQQPPDVQAFLLRTSVLDRLCGPLCEALHPDIASGQETLEYLEQANLFIVPLDNERRWYRYHHLFADLLRQRLHQSALEDGGADVVDLHIRASEWYAERGLDLEAFQHAAAANDIERATCLMLGDGMPLQFRGAVMPVLNWLKTVPTAVLDANPALWVMYASVSAMSGQAVGSVEEKLQAAEIVLEGAEQDATIRNLIGHIAAIRSMMAAGQGEIETIIIQSQRALEYLHPDNLPVRTATTWKLGFAYHLQGDRAAAQEAYAEVKSISQASGNVIFHILAIVSLGIIYKEENQLRLAAQTFQQVLQMVGDAAQFVAFEAHFGLARVHYEWNDLDTAQHHAQLSIQQSRQVEYNDRYIACEVLLARLKLAQGDVSGATALLAQARQEAHQQGFMQQMPGIAALQVLVLLKLGNLAAAAELAETHDIPLSRARVHLAGGDTATALEVLERFCRYVEARQWAAERLRARVLQAIVLQAHDDIEAALEVLGEVLTLAVPEGFVRLFIDEGIQMAQLLLEALDRGMKPDYIGQVLAAFEQEYSDDKPYLPSAQPLIEPLSERELEVLALVALGLSNREIGERLSLALDTIKGHNRRIYGKLHVQRRTEAVARARELGLL